MTKTVDELMRLADAVADAGTQMLPAVEIARRLAALRSALEDVVRDSERYRWLCTSPDAAFFDFEGRCQRADTKTDIDCAIDAAMKLPEAQG